MSIYLKDLEELTLEDIEEFDCLLIWDESEQKTKRMPLQTLVDFIQMLNGKHEKD